MNIQRKLSAKCLNLFSEFPKNTIIYKIIQIQNFIQIFYTFFTRNCFKHFKVLLIGFLTLLTIANVQISQSWTKCLGQIYNKYIFLYKQFCSRIFVFSTALSKYSSWVIQQVVDSNYWRFRASPKFSNFPRLIQLVYSISHDINLER